MRDLGKDTIKIQAPSQNEAAIRLVQADALQVGPLLEVQRSDGSVFPIVSAKGLPNAALQGIMGNRLWVLGDSQMLRDGLSIGMTTGLLGAQAFGQQVIGAHIMTQTACKLWCELIAATTGYTTADFLNNTGANFGKTWIDTLTQYNGAKPSVCILLLGTNDLINGVARATTIANYQRILERMQGAGTLPELCTIFPKPVSGNEHNNVTALNTWIKAYASQNGFPVIDLHQTLVDPVTGSMSATYDAGDGIHQNTAGTIALATAIVNALSPQITPYVPPLPLAADDTTGVITNPLFTVDTNADGVPDGWLVTGGGAPTISLAASPGNVVGNAWSITRGTVDQLIFMNPVGIAAAGHLMEIALRIKTTLQATGSGIHLRVVGGTTGGYQVPALLGGGLSYQNLWQQDLPWTTLYARYTVKAGDANTRIQCDLKGAAGANVTFGQCIIRDLTALGIA